MAFCLDKDAKVMKSDDISVFFPLSFFIGSILVLIVAVKTTLEINV